MIIDCETESFRPGRMAPDVIATGIAPDTILVGQPPGISQPITGFTVDYDMACIAATWPETIPSIVDEYDHDRVVDLRIRCRLRDFRKRGAAVGRYDLATCHARTDGEPHAAKDSPWRERFAELRGLPAASWPGPAREYLLEDLRLTSELAAYYPVEIDEAPQSRYAFALRLMSVWGLAVDEERLARYREGLDAAIDATAPYVDWALRDNGSRDMNAIRSRVREAYGGSPPLTGKGNVRTDADTLRESGDDALEALALYQEAIASRDRELRLLETSPVHTRYDVVVSGRTSSSGPNLQNLRRGGLRTPDGRKWPGSRSVFAPRKGYAWLHFDYPQLELRTFAQVMVTLRCGDTLAKALSAGYDPHSMLAAEILGRSYDETIALVAAGDEKAINARQAAKAANFGFPGGLGPQAFVAFARATYGVRLTIREAARLKALWRKRWPEVNRYAAIVGAYLEKRGRIEHLGSGRIRGHLTYTQACNSLFQGLGGDVTKATLWAITRECLVGDMRGSHPALFVHDEFLIETPREAIDDHATILDRVVAEAWSKWIPDVALGDIGIAATNHWTKDCHRVTDDHGRLRVWGE